MNNCFRFSLLSVLALALSACGSFYRVKNIGRAPKLSPMEEHQVAVVQSSLAKQSDRLAPRDLSLVSPGANGASSAQSTSLWRTGASAFFRDQRAATVGDILTVKIAISDRAQVGNTTSRSRSNSEGAGLDNFLGLETQLDKILPSAVSPGDLVKADSESSTTGSGQVQRSETINLTLAAIITQVLPNGNLVIQGRQEVRVNFEVRELVIAGVVRPQDIATDNTINHTQIAEARISYGGRGHLTDVQQARYGQQLYDILFPF